MWEPCLQRQLCLLSPGGRAYFWYGLCKHSTHTRIYFAMHPFFYVSIVLEFQCFFRCLAWLVEFPLALLLSPRSDLWLRLQGRAFQWISQQVWLANCPTPSFALRCLRCFRSFGLIRSSRSRATSWGGTRYTSLPWIFPRTVYCMLVRYRSEFLFS